MKKLIFAATVLLVSFAFANAQRPVIKVDASISRNNVNKKLERLRIDSKEISGYRLGVSTEIDFTKLGFYLSPGLVFTSKGAEYKEKVYEEDYIGTTETVPGYKSTFHYLQVPVHVGYRIEVNPKTYLSVQFGPYLGYALAGKNSNKEEIFGNFGYKRLDLGIGVQGALSYEYFYVQVGYEQGLLNIDKRGSFKIHNMGYFAGVGVRF